MRAACSRSTIRSCISAAVPRPELLIRVGTPGDYVASALPGTLARFRERWPDVRFVVRTDSYDLLLRELRGGELDVVVGLSLNPPPDARIIAGRRRSSGCADHDPRSIKTGRCRWFPMASPAPITGLAVRLESGRAALGEVFTGPSIASLDRRRHRRSWRHGDCPPRATDLGMMIWEDAPLPKLPDLYRGIYVREGGARAAYEQLADEMAARPAGAVGRRARAGRRRRGARGEPGGLTPPGK